MKTNQLLPILKGRWRTVTAVWLGVMAAVVALTVFMPRQYQASAAVVLDVKSPDPIAGIVLPMTTTSYMSTQADVLRSDRVVLKAIEAVGLDKAPGLNDVWQRATEGRGDFLAWLIARVQKRLDVRPGRDSNVLTVTYTASDAAFAARMANAVVKAFIDTSVELRTEPARDFNEFFDGRAAQLRARLEAAQAKLSSYEKQAGLLANEDRIDLESAKLSDLSRRVIDLQSAANESGSRERFSGTDPSRMTEVLTNSTITTLKSEIARTDARLDELRSRLGDSHPQVIELKANRNQLQKRIDLETGSAAGSAGFQNSITRRRLADAQAAYDAQRQRVLQLKSQHDEASVLAREVQNAQQAYDSGLAQLDRTRMESQTTRTNVSILKEARVPADPSSPVVPLNLLLGFLMASLAATGWVVAGEMRDPKLRRGDDVVELLGLPVLVALGSSSRRVKAMQAPRLSSRPAT